MDSPLIYVLFSVLMLGLAFAGLNYWGQGALSCAELLGAAILLTLFFSLFSVPGGFPWNLLILLVPAGYAATNLVYRRSHNRILREMRSNDYERCRRLIAQDPRNAAAHAMLAQLLEEDGRLAEAMEAYRDVVKYDPNDHAARQRHDRLAERVGLAESGQVKCPGCYTIQPLESGYCWKCGRVYHKQRALLTRFKRLGMPGRVATLLGVAALSGTLSAGVAAVSGEGGGLLVPTLVIPGLLVAVGCGIWLGSLYFRLLEHEAREREP